MEATCRHNSNGLLITVATGGTTANLHQSHSSIGETDWYRKTEYRPTKPVKLKSIP